MIIIAIAAATTTTIAHVVATTIAIILAGVTIIARSDAVAFDTADVLVCFFFLHVCMQAFVSQPLGSRLCEILRSSRVCAIGK